MENLVNIDLKNMSSEIKNLGTWITFKHNFLQN